jgi:hypothetical protein
MWLLSLQEQAGMASLSRGIMDELCRVIDTIRALGLSDRQKEFFGIEQYSPKLQGTYFNQLVTRLEHAQRWAREARPQLTFVGDWHRGPGTKYATSNPSLVHRRRHEWMYGAIKECLHGPLLVALEASGRDGVLDPGTYVAIAREGRVAAGLPPMSFKQMVAAVEDQKHVAWAYMKTKKDIRFICGEEWPHRLHHSMLYAWDMKGQRSEMASRETIDEAMVLLDAFRMLRSDTMVIRTLEWLQHTGRLQGLMLQGNKHLPDVEQRVRSLGLEFQSKRMPPMELVLM